LYFISFQLLPAALNKTFETNRRFREGVPLNLHQNLGVVFSGHDTPERREAIKMIKGMFDKLFETTSIDLPLKEKGQLVAVVKDLWDRGLLMSD
jgi:hypothetical protein